MFLQQTLKTLSTTILLSALMTSANAVQLFATGDNPSASPSNPNDLLYKLDPETGAVVETIGSTGYLINGLAYDATTETMFAISYSFSTENNTLLKINLETGEATEIGTLGLPQFYDVDTLTIDSSGQLYTHSTSEYGGDFLSDLYKINKATGAASVVGPTDIEPYEFSLAFDNTDTLYLAPVFPDVIYKIDTTTAAKTDTLIRDSLSFSPIHHGAFNPETNQLYGLKNNQSTSTAQSIYIMENTGTEFKLRKTLTTNSGIFTLAFIPAQTPPPAPGSGPIVPVVKPVPSVSWFALMTMVFGLALLVLKRRFK